METTANRWSVLGCQLVSDAAREFGEVRLRVTGASMIPAIWPGDIIQVCRETAKLQPGDIVLFRRNEGLVAHRVRHRAGTSLITRGDALQNDDPAIAESHILGKVVFIDRNGRLIRPRQTLLHRACSFFVRRSEFCRHMALRIGLRIIRFATKETAWAN